MSMRESADGVMLGQRAHSHSTASCTGPRSITCCGWSRVGAPGGSSSSSGTPALGALLPPHPLPAGSRLTCMYHVCTLALPPPPRLLRGISFISRRKQNHSPSNDVTSRPTVLAAHLHLHHLVSGVVAHPESGTHKLCKRLSASPFQAGREASKGAHSYEVDNVGRGRKV